VPERSSVGFSGGENEVDLESLRARLRKMTDAELRRDIKAGEYMVSSDANFGKPSRQTFHLRPTDAGPITAILFMKH
jgi:hypothetical protein